jgi:hypothetical protein
MKKRYLAIIPTAVWLLLSQLVVIPARAADNGCSQAANTWIAALGDARHNDIFRRHTRNNCTFSGKWVKQYEQTTDQTARESMCNDLVLIWTHKECGYFRDVINPEAYEPCKAWSREMYQHCMDNDAGWFP